MHSRKYRLCGRKWLERVCRYCLWSSGREVSPCLHLLSVAEKGNLINLGPGGRDTRCFRRRAYARGGTTGEGLATNTAAHAIVPLSSGAS